MNLLVVTHRFPYPPHKGEKIRALNILKFLAARHDIYLASLEDDSNDLRYISELQPYVRSIIVQRLHPQLRRALALSALWGSESITSRYFYSRRLQQRIDDLIDRESIEGIVCSSSPTAEYVFRSRHVARLRTLPKVMDLMDVDSAKWRDFADSSKFASGWLYRREARHVAELECRIGREFDRLFVVSEAERKCLDSGLANRVTAMPNGVDLEYFYPRDDRREEDKQALVFTGVMDYRPNVEGICWFVEQVLPWIRAEVPGARLYVVGNHPARAIRRIGQLPGVLVTGFVADIRDYVSRGVCIVPLQIARGIQNKVLEAMAMARPVILTPQALEGIDAVPGRDVVVAEGARAFADQAVQLLRDPERARALGRAARQRAEARYSWSDNLRVLEALLPEHGNSIRTMERWSQQLRSNEEGPVTRAS